MKFPKNLVKYISVFVLGILVASLGTYVYSVNRSQVSVGIKIVPASIFVYDSTGNVVSNIDFGIINQGSQTLYAYMFIKNLSSGSFTLVWKSTLSSVTANMTDTWKYFGCCQYDNFLNNTVISPGQVLSTQYSVSVSPQIVASTYNWTLTVGALVPS